MRRENIRLTSARLRCLQRFANDHSGAVSIDWVVLTGALTGLSIAIALSFSDAIQGPTGALLSSMRSVSALTFDDADEVSASTAQSFFDLGIGAYPDSRTDAWRAARDAVAAEAPEGYNYDPDYNETRYIDVASGTPIYESDYGTSYSINGQTIEASDYDTAGRISFQAGFNQYWNDTQ